VSGPVADIVVRNWGALIALVGASNGSGLRVSRVVAMQVAATITSGRSICCTRISGP
jgi:hypothetical protein